MRLLDSLFRSKAVEQVLSDDSLLTRMLQVEAALALAEAEVGLIPSDCARVIQSCCVLQNIDPEALTAAAKLSGNLAIPLVKQLTAAVAARDPESAKFVHWGATSQDIIDTALVLQIREALSLILPELEGACTSLRMLTVRHRNTIMPARTWMQHALPTTFGLKTAHMLAAVHRQSIRLRSDIEEMSVLQFGGAVGTLAALGDKGPLVAENLAGRLSLTNPSTPWHTNRERIAELATSLGVLCGVIGKITRDIALMTQTEVGELSESQLSGRGGSSTMPQKNNPVASAAILANVARTPGLVSTLLATMIQEHERGLGGWHAEWETLPELVSLTAGTVERFAELLTGLQVYPDRMRVNLDLTNGLIFAEAVSTALGKKIGKSAAHAIVENAVKQAQDQRRHLLDVLAQTSEITRHFSPSEIAAFFDPERYLGSTQTFIDRVLADCAVPLEVSNAAR